VREVVKFRPRSLSLSLSLSVSLSPSLPARSLGGLEGSWQRNATASLGRSVSQSLLESLDTRSQGVGNTLPYVHRFKDLC